MTVGVIPHQISGRVTKRTVVLSVVMCRQWGFVAPTLHCRQTRLHTVGDIAQLSVVMVGHSSMSQQENVGNNNEK